MHHRQTIMKPNSQISSHLTLAAAAAVVLLAPPAGAVAPGQYHYGLNADWSDVANSNGAWSYNLNNEPIAAHQTFWWGEAGWG
jgi:hypothetical protein